MLKRGRDRAKDKGYRELRSQAQVLKRAVTYGMEKRGKK
jgi:hypothetical protein